MPGRTVDIKNIITQARAKGVPDQTTVEYLQKRGYIDQAGKPLPQFGQGPQPGFATPLTKMDPTGDIAKNMIAGALPVAGSIGGGILGGIGGGIAGGPVGAYGGAVVGATAGGAAGEAGKEKIMGQNISPTQVAKTGTEQGLFEAIGGPVASGLGKLTEGTGKVLATVVIPKTMEESALRSAYQSSQTTLFGRVNAFFNWIDKVPTAGGTAFQKGLMGPEKIMGVGAESMQKALWKNQIGPALTSATEKIDIPAALDKTEKILAASSNNPAYLEELMDAFKSFKNSFKGIGKIEALKAQKMKEDLTKFIPTKMWKGKDVAAYMPNITAALSGVLRKDIGSIVGKDVEQAYSDYSDLYALKDLGISAGAGGIVKPGGSFTGLKNIFETLTVPIGTVGGQTLYKIGRGIEIFGPPGIKTVGQLIGASGSVQNSNPQTNVPPSPQNQPTSTPPTTPPSQ